MPAVNLLNGAVTREQLINLVMSSANLIEEREDIVEYINRLGEVNGMTGRGGKGRGLSSLSGINMTGK